MDGLIQLVIYILLFAIAAYGLKWVCSNFGLPAPIFWICGVILLIIILLFVSNQVGGMRLPELKR